MWKNKKVNISILAGGEKLYYSALVLDINKSLISFIDKYGKYFSYPISSIVEISEDLSGVFDKNIPEEKKEEIQEQLNGGGSYGE